MIILIASTQNPKGRTLIQEDRTLAVLSDCCVAHIKRVSLGVGYEDRCTDCEETLQFNEEGWESVVRHLNKTAKAEGVDRWAAWALHWFGLEGFEIEVTE